MKCGSSLDQETLVPNYILVTTTYMDDDVLKKKFHVMR